MTARAFSALLAVAFVLAFASTAAAREPTPLRGSPLAGTTGLRLVVADSPPFVLDVDTGSVTALRGLQLDAGVGFSVIPVSASAAVVVAWETPFARKQMYMVRSGRTAVTSLGRARDVAPAADGTGVWVTRVVSRGRCVLQRIALDGRRATARAIPCNWIISAGGSLGLLVGRSRVVDPRTADTVLASRRGILAVAGKRLLLTGLGPTDAPNDTLALLDSASGSERTLRVPNRIGSLSPDPAVDPRGRYIAVELGNPSWHVTGTQVLDVWVLDTMTAKLTHLPSMPAFVRLKKTSLNWTHDGRLVLLGEADDGAFVAVWRPGQRTLPLKLIHLPERDGTSDSFAPLA